MNSIRLRFSIGAIDERLDILRFYLKGIPDKRNQSKFIYETLIFKTIIQVPKIDIGALPVSVDLIFTEFSPGLSFVYSELYALPDHQSRSLWMRRYLVAICTGVQKASPDEMESRNFRKPPNESADSTMAIRPQEIASPEVLLKPELAAINRKNLMNFQKI